MAKVSFSKLNTIKTIPEGTVVIENSPVSVAHYLPLEKKMALIESVIAQSGSDEEGFFNIVKLRVYYEIEMLKAYTNISFTEKQLEDIQKLYDAITMNHVWEIVEKEIPEAERDYVWGSIMSLAREVTDYNHSALGILKMLSAQYGEESFSLDKINELLTKAQDPNELKLVKAAIGDMA